MNDRLQPILDECAAGRLPPPIALMHLAAASRDAQDYAAALAGLSEHDDNLRALADLARARPETFDLTRDMLRTVAHDARQPRVEDVAAMFDAAVRRSPAASVALYSLGDEKELRRATEDVVACLDALGLLPPHAEMLDLGCGIGRFLTALAPRLRRLVGVDVSPAMIAEARRRCASFPHVGLQVGSGRDLADIADASVDLVLAADVFPYLMQIGPELAQAHLAEARRVLRADGALVIFNFSYRGDVDADARDLALMAARAGLVRDATPVPPLRRWDAAAFLLRRTGTHALPAH